MIRKAVSVLLFISAMFAVTGSPRAQPALAFGDIHLDEYPNLRFSAVLRNAPMTPGQPGMFELMESGKEGEKPWKLMLNVAGDSAPGGMRPGGNRAGNGGATDWYLVIDTTRSISKDDFRSSLDIAARFAESLPPGDRAAVYTFSRRRLTRRELSHDRNGAAHEIRAIARRGRTTLLFDSLYSALAKARKGDLAGDPRGKRRKAMLLLTDGRDEGSEMTIKDCLRIAGTPGEGGMPVHVLLFGRVLNRAALHSLAEASGGRFFAGLGDGPLRLLERRSVPRHTYQFRARSKAASMGVWPGKTATLELVWKSPDGLNEVRARHKYEMTWALWFKSIAGGKSTWLLIGLALFLLLLLIIFLMMFPGGRAGASDVRETKAEPPVVESDEYRLPIGAETTPEPEPAPIELPDPEIIEPAPRDLAAVEALAHAMHETGPRPPAPGHTVYMQSYSYQILQDALRSAPRYKAGKLVLRDPRNREDRREYDLFMDTTVLGNGRWANIHLDDPIASPVHARVRRADGAFIIYDMVSGTGVYLNGKKLLRPRGLVHGDELKLGRTYFTFRGA